MGKNQNSFGGLCIGGPLDGQWVESEYMIYRAVTSTLTCSIIDDTEFPVEHHNYHREIVKTDAGDIVFWRSQTKTLHQILSELCTAYTTLKVFKAEHETPYNIRIKRISGV